MLQKCFSVGIGGLLGAVCRFLLEKSLSHPLGYNSFPYATLLINLLGCFALGFLLSCGLELTKLHPNVKLALTTGFIGSFTTFSTLEVELLQSIQQSNLQAGFIYLLASLGLGFLLCCLGVKCAQLILARILTANEEKEVIT